MGKAFTFNSATKKKNSKCKLNRLQTLICEAENPVFSVALGNLKGSGLLLCIHAKNEAKLATGKTVESVGETDRGGEGPCTSPETMNLTLKTVEVCGTGSE